MLGRLRRWPGCGASGGIGPGTTVIAVHLTTTTRSAPTLPARGGQAGWPCRTLVLGGTRSGKPLQAERRLETFAEVAYAATGGSGKGDRERAHGVEGSGCDLSGARAC
ncbi:hypothetical protein ACFQ78_10965 [Streptomyces sp. NPDC056519]|uniref:hypothetical protein n=1 Tax=Streptomyces sp. NPDC056519 TaxID=3345849 RepID=UPI00369C5A72